MQTNELTGALLNYWVARAEGYIWAPDITPQNVRGVPLYSTDWALGGPIIEREKIDLMHVEYRPEMGGKPCEPWNASMQTLSIDNPDWDSMSGTTALEAAMRAFVGSHFGETVDDSPAAQEAGEP